MKEIFSSFKDAPNDAQQAACIVTHLEAGDKQPQLFVEHGEDALSVYTNNRPNKIKAEELWK